MFLCLVGPRSYAKQMQHCKFDMFFWQLYLLLEHERTFSPVISSKVTDHTTDMQQLAYIYFQAHNIAPAFHSRERERGVGGVTLWAY